MGRTRARDIHIKDSAVSEKHAELSWEGSRWTVTDVGSSNGTVLNGKKLEEGMNAPLRAASAATLQLKNCSQLHACIQAPSPNLKVSRLNMLLSVVYLGTRKLLLTPADITLVSSQSLHCSTSGACVLPA